MADKSFLDWPFLEPAHRELAASLDAWAADNLGGIDEADVDAACRELVRRLAADSWLDHCVPAADGGASEKLDVRALCLIRETLARHSGLADFAFAMQGLGSGAISLYGSDDIRSAYLPAVRTGQKIAAFALSEPEAGSDVAALATTAVRDGNGWRIDGEKTWISNGGIADYYTVFARTGEAPGARGLSAFVVDADTPGLEIAERIEVIAPHPLARLTFDNCQVSADRLLGAPSEGFKVAMAPLDIFRSTVGRHALDLALDRAATRELFGGPLADLQMIQAKLADMALAVDASALLVYRAAWTKDVKADRVTREASMAKLHATESAQTVIDEAVQIFGGQGVVSGAAVEKLYREIRALRIYEGASEVQKVVIAKAALAAREA